MSFRLAFLFLVGQTSYRANHGARTPREPAGWEACPTWLGFTSAASRSGMNRKLPGNGLRGGKLVTESSNGGGLRGRIAEFHLALTALAGLITAKLIFFAL